MLKTHYWTPFSPTYSLPNKMYTQTLDVCSVAGLPYSLPVTCLSIKPGE